MRKVILYVNLTLDGMLSGPAGELDWMLPDPELNVEFSDRLRAETDTILLGRNVYEAFEGVFRQQAADPASPPELADFATWMVETPKVVFSRNGEPGPSVAGNPVATHGGADLAGTVAALKEQPGKAMVLFGGVEIAQHFTRLGLVDEYWIKLYPTVLGAGRPLFTELDRRADLELIDGRTYASGVATLRYATQG